MIGAPPPVLPDGRCSGAIIHHGFSFPEGYTLRFELLRVFLPKLTYSVTGPGGVEASFDWRAAFDDSERSMLRAHLLNDATSYS